MSERRSQSPRLDDPMFARFCAIALVRNAFNLTVTAREVIRPYKHVIRGKERYRWAQQRGRQIAEHPLVLKEVARIMDQEERNAQKFFARMWEWMEKLDQHVTSGTVPPKHVLEAGKLAVANLAKGYIGEGTDTNSARMSQAAPDPRLAALIGTPKREVKTPLVVVPSQTDAVS